MSEARVSTVKSKSIQTELQALQGELLVDGGTSRSGSASRLPWVGAADGRRQTLGPGSLVILPWLDLSGWGTSGASWRFYWFEFFADQVEPFLLPDAMPVPHSSSEQRETTEIQSQIRSPLSPSRAAASARFSAMLYRWLEQVSIEPTSQKRYKRIEKAIELMHASIDQQLSVGEMAAQAGLPTRSFVAAFEQATGHYKLKPNISAG